jgi:hypothetical protein
MRAVAFAGRIQVQDIPSVVIQQRFDLSLALAVCEGEIDDELMCQIRNLTSRDHDVSDLQLVLDFFLVSAFAEKSLPDIYKDIVSKSTARRLHSAKLIAAVVCPTGGAEQNCLVRPEPADIETRHGQRATLADT